VRYLCARHSMGNFYPEDLHERASADKWMDWSSINLASFNPVYLDQYFRLPESERSDEALAAAVRSATPWLDILNAQLADNAYINGENLSMADFPAGSIIHRWIHWTPNRPSHPNVEAYYERLLARPAYQEHVVKANAPRTDEIQSK